MRGILVPLFLAVILAGALVPLANANHCTSKINVYGRVLVAPLAPPPYTSSTHNACLHAFGNENIVNEHALPPNTDQIFVRVNGDFGPSVPKLRMTLHGLGFVANDQYLHRTSNTGGGSSYNIADWLALPEGPMDGELNVTVYYGALPYTVKYRTTATIIPPTIVPPPPPTPPAPPTPPTVPTVP